MRLQDSQTMNIAMKISILSRCTASCAIVAFLAGCGAPPVSLPQGQNGPQARIAPSQGVTPAGRKALLYVSDNSLDKVYVLTYPNGRRYATLTGFDTPIGECVDTSGRVWIVNGGRGQSIVEYAHGGTTPLATLTASGSPVGCSVDPTTGNLAVTNEQGTVSIYKNASGIATTYSDRDIRTFFWCAYDNAGRLFIDGATDGLIAELPKGGRKLETITLGQDIVTGSMMWDGSYLAIVEDSAGKGPATIARVSVSGSKGTIVSTVQLESPEKKHKIKSQFWIQGNTIIGPDRFRQGRRSAILTWQYPKGGEPGKPIRVDWKNPEGVTLSPPPP